MQLQRYIDNLRQELAVAAEAGGDEARALAQRLTGPLESGIRVTLLDALSAAAAEITQDLAPGSVEVRLRGRDPEFVVTAPPSDEEFTHVAAPEPVIPADADESTARVSLRLPDSLKTRIEEAANREGLSVNSWLVRAAAAGLEGRGSTATTAHRAPRAGDSFTGWVR
ncbi:ribbon-helix-helix domain-containing protein [Aldersonia kunmingensis]|uniref:ribbon-helix-helix domain-containing protein n=1 Tax=Aldersonia kunmingensis TaxID=408066 RepID=UPI0008310306|nr:ribbon-helix-helix domain-containing protein [Aldersonia kunmingensis]